MWEKNIKIFVKDSNTDCTQSSFSINRVRAFLQYNNYTEVSTVEEATHIIINTCGVLKNVEDRMIDYIWSLENEIVNTNKTLMIYGCLVNISPQRLKEIHFCKHLIGTKQYREFNDIFSSRLKIENISSKDINEYSVILNGIHKRKKEIGKRFYVEIARGCIHHCSYCVIKRSIGHVKSRPKEEILHDISKALQEGYTEIFLVSDDAWSYGLDIWIDFADLFNSMCELWDSFTIDIDYIEPWQLLLLFPKISHNFYRVSKVLCPIQSTNNKILSLMKRKYTIEDIEKLLELISKYGREDIIISNHIIYCYPYETEEDFRNNIKFSQKFTHTLLIMYSHRSITSKFEPQELISDEVKAKRYLTVKKLQIQHPDLFWRFN